MRTQANIETRAEASLDYSCSVVGAFLCRKRPEKEVLKREKHLWH